MTAEPSTFEAQSVALQACRGEIERLQGLVEGLVTTTTRHWRVVRSATGNDAITWSNAYLTEQEAAEQAAAWVSSSQARIGGHSYRIEVWDQTRTSIPDRWTKVEQ